MSVTSTPTNTPDVSERPTREAPLTLTTEPPRPLRFTDQLAMWANLGISLFGPLTGALIATTAGSVGLAIAAIVIGCGLGAILLGASAVIGAATGAPAMVSLRGLVGRRGSVLPTLLNIAQNVGWATMEIIVISTAAVAVLGQSWRWPFRDLGRSRRHSDGGAPAGQRTAVAQDHGLAGARCLGVPVRPGALAAAAVDPSRVGARFLAGR